jgi:hypothetical protein
MIGINGIVEIRSLAARSESWLMSVQRQIEIPVVLRQLEVPMVESWFNGN